MNAAYRAAMLAYPRAFRRVHGEEVAATAWELAGGRWSARQVGALVVHGLRARARLSAGSSPLQAVISGIGLAVVLSYLTPLALTISLHLNRTVEVVYLPSFPVVLLLSSIPLAVLLVTTRWPAALALAALLILSLRLGQATENTPFTGHILASRGPAIALAGVVAVAGCGRRAIAPWGALGLLALLVGVGLVWSPTAMLEMTGWAQLVALPLVGLALVALDPRPLAAGCTAWLLTGIEAYPYTPGYAAVASAAAALGLLATWYAGRWSLRADLVA